MLTRLYVDNYRCFVNFELRPGRLNLLLGDNGSGKTTLFEVMATLRDLIIDQQPVDDAFPEATLTRWQTRREQSFGLELGGAGGNYAYALVVAHDPTSRGARIASERLTWNGLTLYEYADGHVRLHDDAGAESARFPVAGSISFLALIDARPETARITEFKAFLSTTWLLKLDPSDMADESEEEEPSLSHDGDNFASWYRHIVQSQPEVLEDLNSHLRDILQGFKRLKLIAAPGGRSRHLVATFEPGRAAPPIDLHFGELSDGQRVLVVLYTLLAAQLFQTHTLLLDEPDNFVGLPEIQPWLVRVVDALSARGQAFVVSHHPGVIDYLAPHDVWRFTRPQGAHVIVERLALPSDDPVAPSEAIARRLLDE